MRVNRIEMCMVKLIRSMQIARDRVEPESIARGAMSKGPDPACAEKLVGQIAIENLAGRSTDGTEGSGNSLYFKWAIH